eukprot:4804170-Pyramimonas_sp.AAC.1
MPGPDGIVYSCWKSPLPIAILYDLYCHLFDNRASDMPHSMRELLLDFLAKGENPTDLSACPSRVPDACRPLAMANTG